MNIKVNKLTKITYFLSCLVLGLIFSYLVAVRILISYVNDYRSDLEEILSDIISVPINIDKIEGRLIGFNPAIIMHNIKIGDLIVPKLDVVLSVTNTILNRDIYLDAVAVSNIAFEAQQNSDNSWQILNLPKFEQTNNDDNNVDIPTLLEYFAKLGNVVIYDSKVTFKPLKKKELELSNIHIAINNHKASGIFNVAEDKRFAFKANFNLDETDLLKSSAQIYVDTPNIDWLSLGLPEQLNFLHITKLEAEADVWLEIAQGKLQKSSVLLSAPIIELAPNNKKVILQNVNLASHFNTQENGMLVQIDDLGFTFADKKFPELQFVITQNAKKWQLVADRIDIEPIFKLVPLLAPIPKNVADFFIQMKPYGILRNVQVNFDPNLDLLQRISFDAELDKVGIKPYWHIPGTDNVSGSVHGALAGGELRLNTSSFGLHLAEFFPHNWVNHTAQGRLTWSVDEDKFQLALPYSQITSDAGNFFGDMLLQIGFNDEVDNFLDLRVGAKNANAKFTEQFLPTLIPAFDKDLANWLKQSIKSGAINEGFFEYQGSISAKDPIEARKINLYFDVNNAHLAYWDGFPDLTKSKAQIFIENEQVKIVVPKAIAGNSTITNAKAQIDYKGSKKIPHLLVTGNIKSKVNDALQVLQNAPIDASSVFKDWYGEGNVTGNLYLDIPFAKNLETCVKVGFNLANAKLNLPNPKLDITDITGNFIFDTEKGLSAPKVSAKALNSKVSGRVVSANDKQKPFSKFILKGKINSSEILDWLDLPVKSNVKGNFAYDLILNLADKSNEIQINTDLAGVQIDLPKPFNKTAQDKKNTQINIIFDDTNLQIKGGYADLARFAINYPKFDLQNYRVAVNFGVDEVNAPKQHGIKLTGNLSNFDVENWIDFIKTLNNQDNKSNNKNELNKFNYNLILDSNLNIKQFKLFDTNITNLNISTYNNKTLNVYLDSEVTKGKVILNDVITVDLDYLFFKNIDNNNNKENTKDILSELDITKFPKLNLNIDNLSLNEDYLGEISFETNYENNKLHISNILANIKMLNIEGNLIWQQTNNNNITNFKGSLSGVDISRILRNFGYAPTLTSNKFKTNIEAFWPSTLSDFDINKVSGTTSIDIRSGRLLEVDASADALKVFSLLNFNSLNRRLKLDFSDIFKRGLSFDKITGELVVNNGIFETVKPLKIIGSSSDLELNGKLDMPKANIDASLNVKMPLTSNLPIAAVIAGFSPAVGGALFIVDKVIGDKVSKIASVNYHITGNIENPNFKLVGKSKK